MNLKSFHKTTFARYFTLLVLALMSASNVWGVEYKLVTSTSELTAGCKYIIGNAKDGDASFMSNVSNNNNRKVTNATISNKSVTLTDEMLVLELGGSEGAWTFLTTNYKGTNGYLASAASGKNNYCRVIDDVTTCTISFSTEEADAVIKLQPHTERNILRFNSNLFACYSSGQSPVYLFKEDKTAPSKTLTSIAISGSPTKTTYNAGEEFDPAGLTVTGTYSDASTAPITSGIKWSVNPSPLTVGTTSVSVTATVGEVTSAAYQVKGLTVNAASRWEKVTSAPDDWTGEYLLVYESDGTAYVWTGVDAANCYVSATISNNQISKPSNAVILSVVAMEGGYSILVNGGTNKGKYISGKSDKNTINFTDDEQLNTFSYSDNGITITSNTYTIQYNSDSGQQRFRYYSSTQKPVQLYRIASSDSHISATPTSIAFVLKELQGGTATDSKEIEVTGHNLTSAISAKMKSGSSSIFSCSGTLTKDGGTLTISYTTNTAGKYDDIVVLSSTGAKDVEIPVSAEIVNHIPVLQSIYIKGAPTQTTYEVGDAFKTDGLEVWGKYDEGADKQITEGIEWTVDPEIFESESQTYVNITATALEKTSESYKVNVTVKNTPKIIWNLSIDETATVNEDEISWVSDVATMKDEKGENGTPANNYYGGDDDNHTSTRFYKNSVLTITPQDNCVIAKVEFNATSEGYATALGNITWTNATTSVNKQIVTVTPTDGMAAFSATIGGTCGFTKVIVYYSASGKTLKSIAISGTPTKTTYEAGEEFDPTGLVVTGTYDDGSKADVTARASWSFNPSTLSVGTTSVSVTATVGEKSDTQTVSGLTVNAAPQKVKFDFATNLYGHKGVSSGSDNHDGDLVDNEVFTEVPVDITFSQNPNKTTTRFWDNKGKKELRIYEGSSFTIKSDGNKITKVEFTGTVNLTANESPVKDRTWTGKQSIVTFVNTDNGNSALTSITVYYEEAAPSVSDPTITPSVEAETYWEPFTVTLACAISGASIYYTTDGTDPTTTSTKYSKPFQVSETTVVKAIATKSGLDDSNIVSKKFTFGQIFNSLEELVAADLKSGTIVKVSFENVPIKNIYVTEAGYRNGIFFDIQKEGNDIELYYQNVPMDWVVGGFVSGTITCPWKTYNKTWELAPENKTWDWNNLTYTAPASVTAKITSTGYATFSSNAALDLSKLPAGLTAYKGVVNGNRISLTPVTTAVPASTGLFLKGTANATYSIPVAQGNPTALADNCFLPTTGGKLAKGSLVYVIAKNEFEALEKDLVVSLGKAYIANASDVKALSLFFDEADGINSISTSSMMNNQVFNLSGQKVDNSFKGIVIINGKKVLKK